MSLITTNLRRQTCTVGAAICICGFIVGCAAPITPANNADAAMAKQLIGPWEHVHGNPKQSWLKSGEYVFKRDGTFTSVAHGVGNGLNLRIHVEGKWRIENGFLVEEVTKISHPQFAPVGLVTRDRIVALRDGSLSTRTPEGNEWRMRRKRS